MNLGRGFGVGMALGVNAARSGIDVYNQQKDREREQATRDAIAGVAGAQAAPVDMNDQSAGPQPEGGVKFLDKTYAQGMTPEDQATARNAAMAGVLEKSGDPERAMRFRQMAAQGTLTDIQVKDAQTLRTVDKDTGEFLKKRLTSEDGTVRDPTNDDLLSASQFKISKLVGAGRIDAANALAKDNLALTQQKITTETAERNQALGQVAYGIANGDYSLLPKFYEKYVPDGARITNVSADPKTGTITLERESVDGRKLSPQTAPQAQLLATLKSFSDPEALFNFSQNVHMADLKDRADKREDKRVALEGQRVGIEAGRAGTSNRLANAQIDKIEEGTKKEKELAEIHDDLATAIDAGDKKAEDAARRKLGAYVMSGRGATQGMSVLEKDANLYLASGKAATMADAIDMARTKVQSSARDDYIKLTTGQVPMSEEQINKTMTRMHGADWETKMQGGQAQGGVGNIATDPRAISIRDNKTLTIDQKKAALKQLGYN